MGRVKQFSIRSGHRICSPVIEADQSDLPLRQKACGCQTDAGFTARILAAIRLPQFTPTGVNEDTVSRTNLRPLAFRSLFQIGISDLVAFFEPGLFLE